MIPTTLALARGASSAANAIPLPASQKGVFRFVRRSRRSCALRQPAKKRLRFEPLEDRRLLTTFTVSSAANDGAGSLREAL
ncbi:MAG: hypothetical protein K2Y37_26955, partial [Pirellulales bacterium]|nr:hypothetical protein [Pirellulales bacterium]